MEEFFSQADTADVPGLWKAFSAFYKAHGIRRLTTIHMPAIGGPGTAAIHMQGYPAEWTQRYLDGMHTDDPFRLHATVHGTPFRWSAIRALRALTPAQEAYLAGLAKVHGGDGIAIPVFGPHGRNGCVEIALPKGEEPGRDVERLFRIVAQYAHQRYCEIVSDDDALPLSPRELEVLAWVARGKSNSVIADIIGVSANTVDTHLRRIYAKLDVSDRVSAALAGIGRGLVEMP